MKKSYISMFAKKLIKENMHRRPRKDFKISALSNIINKIFIQIEEDYPKYRHLKGLLTTREGYENGDSDYYGVILLDDRIATYKYEHKVSVLKNKELYFTFEEYEIRDVELVVEDLYESHHNELYYRVSVLRKGKRVAYIKSGEKLYDLFEASFNKLKLVNSI